MMAAPTLAVVLTPAFAVLTPALVAVAATLMGTVAAQPARRQRLRNRARILKMDFIYCFSDRSRGSFLVSGSLSCRR